MTEKRRFDIYKVGDEVFGFAYPNYMNPQGIHLTGPSPRFVYGLYFITSPAEAYLSPLSPEDFYKAWIQVYNSKLLTSPIRGLDDVQSMQFIAEGKEVDIDFIVTYSVDSKFNMKIMHAKEL